MHVNVVHALGKLNKIDKQLALLCFIMVVIKRDKLASFTGLGYCHYSKKDGFNSYNGGTLKYRLLVARV